MHETLVHPVTWEGKNLEHSIGQSERINNKVFGIDLEGLHNAVEWACRVHYLSHPNVLVKIVDTNCTRG